MHVAGEVEDTNGVSLIDEAASRPSADEAAAAGNEYAQRRSALVCRERDGCEVPLRVVIDGDRCVVDLVTFAIGK